MDSKFVINTEFDPDADGGMEITVNGVKLDVSYNDEFTTSATVLVREYADSMAVQPAIREVLGHDTGALLVFVEGFAKEFVDRYTRELRKEAW